MAGGVLKGFGVLLIVLGSLAVVLGLVAALFGAYVANEEDNRGFFGDREKAEGGVILGLGGLTLAGLGVVLLLLGILLYAWGASRARKEMMQALAAGQAAGAVPVPLELGRPGVAPGLGIAPGPGFSPAPAPSPPPAPAPAPPVRARTTTPGAVDGRVVGAVVGLVLLVLVLFLVFRPGGPAGGIGEDPPREVQVETFPGTLQNVQTPLGTRLTGDPRHEMRLAQDGVVVARASLNWTAAPGGQTLAVVLEGQQGGEWVELARGEGGPGLTVESAPTALTNLVRARVSFPASGGGGSVDYTLTLTVIPA